MVEGYGYRGCEYNIAKECDPKPITINSAANKGYLKKS